MDLLHAATLPVLAVSLRYFSWSLIVRCTPRVLAIVDNHYSWLIRKFKSHDTKRRQKSQLFHLQLCGFPVCTTVSSRRRIGWASDNSNGF